MSNYQTIHDTASPSINMTSVSSGSSSITVAVVNNPLLLSENNNISINIDQLEIPADIIKLEKDIKTTADLNKATNASWVSLPY